MKTQKSRLKLIVLSTEPSTIQSSSSPDSNPKPLSHLKNLLREGKLSPRFLTEMSSPMSKPPKKTLFRISDNSKTSKSIMKSTIAEQDEQKERLRELRKIAREKYFFKKIYNRYENLFDNNYLFNQLNCHNKQKKLISLKSNESKIYRPSITNNKITLVFELNNTLIYSTIGYCATSDFRFNLNSSRGIIRYSIFLRPHIKNVLFKLSQNFDLIIFTTTSQDFADRVLSVIDPFQTIFSQRYYRHHCHVNKENNQFIKVFNMIEKPISEIFVVDTSFDSTHLSLNNVIPIIPFLGNVNDIELLELESFLSNGLKKPDFHHFISQFFQIEDLKTSTSAENLNEKVYINLSKESNQYRKMLKQKEINLST